MVSCINAPPPPSICKHFNPAKAVSNGALFGKANSNDHCAAMRYASCAHTVCSHSIRFPLCVCDNMDKWQGWRQTCFYFVLWVIGCFMPLDSQGYLLDSKSWLILPRLLMLAPPLCRRSFAKFSRPRKVMVWQVLFEFAPHKCISLSL